MEFFHSSSSPVSIFMTITLISLSSILLLSLSFNSFSDFVLFFHLEYILVSIFCLTCCVCLYVFCRSAASTGLKSSDLVLEEVLWCPITQFSLVTRITCSRDVSCVGCVYLPIMGEPWLPSTQPTAMTHLHIMGTLGRVYSLNCWDIWLKPLYVHWYSGQQSAYLCVISLSAIAACTLKGRACSLHNQLRGPGTVGVSVKPNDFWSFWSYSLLNFNASKIKLLWFSKPDVTAIHLFSVGHQYVVWDLILLLLFACDVSPICGVTYEGFVPTCVSAPSTLFVMPFFLWLAVEDLFCQIWSHF